MKTDPIVAQVRRVRTEIETECGGDMHALYLKAMAAQQLRGAALIARTGTRPQRKPGLSHPPPRRRKAAA